MTCFCHLGDVTCGESSQGRDFFLLTGHRGSSKPAWAGSRAAMVPTAPWGCHQHWGNQAAVCKGSGWWRWEWDQPKEDQEPHQGHLLKAWRWGRPSRTKAVPCLESIPAVVPNKKTSSFCIIHFWRVGNDLKTHLIPWAGTASTTPACSDPALGTSRHGALYDFKMSPRFSANPACPAGKP